MAFLALARMVSLAARTSLAFVNSAAALAFTSAEVDGKAVFEFSTILAASSICCSAPFTAALL